MKSKCLTHALWRSDFGFSKNSLFPIKSFEVYGRFVRLNGSDCTRFFFIRTRKISLRLNCSQFSHKNEAQLFLTVLSFLRGSFFLSIKKSRSSLIYQKPEAQFFFQMFLIFRKSEARVFMKLFFKKEACNLKDRFGQKNLLVFWFTRNVILRGTTLLFLKNTFTPSLSLKRLF